MLGLALIFTPVVLNLLAPGFASDPGRFVLAVELTRITFPYLLLITLVTLYGGILNALQRFAVAAAAPILLNFSMIIALLLAAFFPTAGHAAAWGVLISGVLQALLVGGDAWRIGALPRIRWPEFDSDVRQFFRALGPATVGSAGVQLALLADTIIASFLPVGAVSALYYADRLNQLPIGVIGIAAGTVVLPEMSRRLAAADQAGAADAQNRAIEFTLFLSIPAIAAFLIIPDLIIRALFMRGAFHAADVTAAAHTLAAYAFGLLPFVLIRSVVASFFARGDTATPVKAALVAAVVNIGFKLFLSGSLAQVGLALATSIGAWINLGLVIWFAKRANYIHIDERLRRSIGKFTIAGLAMAVTLWFLHAPMLIWMGSGHHLGELVTLVILGTLGAAVYIGVILMLFGQRWLKAFRARRGK